MEGSDRAEALAPYALAYEEAIHAVASQRAATEGLRSRAGLLLSGAAIATSFLGGQALRDGNPGPWSWGAIVAFGLLGAATLVVLWPSAWEFDTEPRAIIATYIETDTPLPIAEIQRDLALHRTLALETNGRRLIRALRAFRVAAVLLLIEIVAWSADLATRLE